MQANATGPSTTRRRGTWFLVFVVLSAALRRPIVEAVGMSPRAIASRFELLASSNLPFVLALLPGLLAAPKVWAKLGDSARKSLYLGLALGGITLLSGAWSEDPTASVGTVGMALLSSTALLGSFAWTFSREEPRAGAVVGTLALWLLASAFALRLPSGWSRAASFGGSVGSDWVGLFGFGNSLGEFAGLTFIFAAGALLVTVQMRRWFLATLTASLLQLAMLTVLQSGHATGSIGLMCAGLATGAVVTANALLKNRVGRESRTRTLSLGLPAATSTGIVGIILLGDQVSDLLGKPPGLHRTKFWVEALRGAWDRPLLGWGWDGYMSNPAYGQLFDSWSQLDPHNFFLQVLLSAGIFAFALVLAWTLFGLYLCGSAVSHGGNPITFVALPVFLIVCLTATTVGVLNVYLVAVLAMLFVLAGETNARGASRIAD